MYYQTYHKKCWAFKQAMKQFKRWKFVGDLLFVIFSSGGLASRIATGGVSLIAISTAAILIQGWMKHKDLDLKIPNCTYAYQSYQHLLINIKNIMRTGEYNQDNLLSMMKNIDDIITDTAPIVDKFLLKHDKIFTC